MSVFADPLSSPAPISSRRTTGVAGALLGLAVGALAWRLSPTPGAALALGAIAALAAIAFAATAEDAALVWGWRIFAGAAAFVGLMAAAPLDAERRELLFGFGSLALLAGGTWTLVRSVARAKPPLALFAVLAAALCAFNAYYVIASHDLMIADFMFYRVVSIAVATILRTGRVAALLMDLAGSMKQDYSWAPALAPGLAMALFGPLSRAVYQATLMILYATPALMALGWLAREIARRAGAGRGASLAFAVAGICAAYPFGIVVAARGMPDIGGLALVVLALHIADRLTRALALPPQKNLLPPRGGGLGWGALAANFQTPNDPAARPTRRAHPSPARLAFSLALTLFAMFLFRRWYAFAAVGIAAMLALEITAIALKRGAAFPWRAAILCAAIGALTLLALLSPVLIDWLSNPAAHDYSTIYAAYRKNPAALVAAVGDWCGYAPLAFALAGAAFVIFRSRRGRLARMTLGASAIAALLFSRVQSPYPHHLYLIAPVVTVFIAAPLTMLFARSRAAGAVGLALLAAATLTPAGALAPHGIFPTAGLPHTPRSDLDELARMKAWVDARATPEHKVCGLGSSYTFSGQLIDELWQLKADKSPLVGDPRLKHSVAMTDIDTVEGPPRRGLKDCAILIVGDPVQTHVIASYQLTVTLPSQEMLTGVGIGAHYRRMGEVFHLEHGVSAVAFEQTSMLTDADMDALADRWRAARVGQR